MRLSEHFTLDEFVDSPTAKEKGIANVPNAVQIDAMKNLCLNVLEPVRKYFGKPVRIKSGFRSPALNKAIGGASTSQHMKGEAADIEIAGVRNDAIFNFIITHLNFDQCIAEKLSMSEGSKGWVHVSYSVKNRCDTLSCTASGEYVKGLVYVA